MARVRAHAPDRTQFGIVAEASDEPGSSLAVEWAWDAFYGALNHVLSGDAKAMRDLWSSFADVTVIDLWGRRHAGQDQVLEYWTRLANVASCGKVCVSERSLCIRANLAYTTATETVRATLRHQPVRFAVRATNIYCLVDGLWRLTHRHTDPAPVANPLERTPITIAR